MALYRSLPDNELGAATTAGSFSGGLLGVLMAGKGQEAFLSGAGGGTTGTVETLETGTGGAWMAGPAKSPKSSSLSSREAGWD